LCRFALVEHLITTIKNIKFEDEDFSDSFFTLFIGLFDFYPLVSDESFVGISYNITKAANDFISSLSEFFDNLNHTTASNTLISLLGCELQNLQHETSSRVIEKLQQFMDFLEHVFNHEIATPLESDTPSCLWTKLSKNGQELLNPFTFSPHTMNVKDTQLLDRPSMSPSGAIDCGEVNSFVYCQASNQNPESYNFFKSKLLVSSAQNKFLHLIGNRTKNQQQCVILTFIDDDKLLGVSSRSQVIVVDLNEQGELISPF
jgi:hypothetical protein